MYRDIAQACYEACEVGSVGFMRPDPALGEKVSDFGAVLIAAGIMQEDGRILIQNIHHESESGNKMVDMIKFYRLR